jgi:hypothetical protein
MLVTYQRFKNKFDYSIPNIEESGYSFVESTIPIQNWQGEYVQTPCIRIVNAQNETLFAFKKNPYYLTLFEYNKELVKQFIDAPALDSNKDAMFMLFIDELYNKYNKTAIGTKSNNIYKKSIIELTQRTADFSIYRHSTRTKELMLAFKEYLERNARLVCDKPEDSLEFYLACVSLISSYLRDRLRFCLATRQVIGRYESSRYKIKSNWVYMKAPHNPESLGYTRGSNGNYMNRDEFEFNGIVYHNSVERVECPCCQQRVPVPAFNEDEGECDVCANTAYQIQNYSTRAPQLLGFKAKKVKPDTLYLGVELEFETSDRDLARRKVGKALRGHAIMKSDGSIHHGFEVVTCPATLDIHLEVFKKFYESKINELQNASNVGMHVHVSRRPLSVLTVGKITAFMNNEDNKTFITKIAGRSPNNYCRQDIYRSFSYPLTHSNGGDRYNTLNLQNRETIEFRIFSTPLNYEEFASKVQFCQAIVEYCKPAAIAAKLDVIKNYKTFLGWLSTQRKSYPELCAKLKGVA